MKPSRASHWLVWMSLGAVLVPASAWAQKSPDPLAARAREILQKHCFECHGKDPKKLKGQLNLFDPAHLADAERKIVVPRDPKDSVLMQQIEDGTMPPGKRPPVPEEERKELVAWITAGAPPLPGGGPKPQPVTEETPVVLASQVKEVFRKRCFDCHGGKKTSVGVKVLDLDNLVKQKKKVVPANPDESILFQVISSTGQDVMPPSDQPRLTPDEVALVKRWISKGAPAFPPDVAVPVEAKKDNAFKNVVGVDYVLKKILAHVRDLDPTNRRFYRYVSLNHILTEGATEDALELERDALAKAINHLSWEGRIVRPVPIDPPTNSVFALDLRQLGWHITPFRLFRNGKDEGAGPYNLYDLVLLEYPYAISYEDSRTFDRLAEEFLIPSEQVRPIPYVRSDWFVSTVTQPTLYEDLLQLPFTVQKLEKLLDLDTEANLRDNLARRAGMTVSFVSHNNRVVERHPLKRGGSYWKSFDFRSSRGRENMFKDPINLNPTGGEFVFTLPNKLQGYYVADSHGRRLEAAPTDIVTDKFASDQTVRNGLACMRCHDKGMKEFTDSVRPALLRLPGSPGFDRRLALDLYPEQEEMNKLLAEDRDRFLQAMKEVLGGKPQTREPLYPVAHRYLDDPLLLTAAAGELGLIQPQGLEAVFRTKGFTGLGLVALSAEGMVRRDAWEDYYDLVVGQLGLGIPVVPLDGNNRRDYPAGPAPFEVELKTSKRTGVFEPGDKVFIVVTNKSAKPLYIELIGTGTRGQKVIIASSDTLIKPGETLRFGKKGLAPAGPEGDDQGIPIKADVGKEQITLFASDAEFPCGELLRDRYVVEALKRGLDSRKAEEERRMADRVVHPFYRLQSKDGRIKLSHEPTRLVKKTIEIETR